MALQFILGGAGSGKSYELQQQVIGRSMAEPEGRFLMIVPEQFTMQTQRDLVMAHDRGGISNIDVLSFMRLAYRVFEEIGMPEKLVLEDTGKNMVLRKLLTGLEPQMSYFKHIGRKQGFVEELKSLLTELYQYSVTPEYLKQVVSGLEKKPLLQKKLSDTLLVYQAFQQYKQREGLTVEEEMLDLLCEVLPESRFIEDAIVCLDGFTGFTPSQNKLLRLILVKARDVVVTVSIDPAEPLESDDEEFRLFHLSKKTIRKLRKMAEEEHVPVANHFYTHYERPYPQLRHLERHLFRYPVAAYRTVSKEEGDCEERISFSSCRNPHQEAELVLTEVARLVREEGYRYRDIAVITGEMATYGELLAEAFDRGGIYYFLDQKRDIMRNPLVEFVRAALAVVEDDFDYESVMRYLRSGLCGVDLERVDLFENELLARGIRGRRRYEEGWPKPKKHSGQEADQQEIYQIIEEVRRSIWQAFSSLVSAFRGTAEDRNKGAFRTGASMTQALYDFLLYHHAEEKIEDLRLEFEQSGNLLMEKEYAQVYRLVMGIFDKMVSLLGEEELTMEEYRQILESGFSEEQVGVIPPGIDHIVVGDLERTRLNGIRALFCLGVNEGIVPKSGSTGGILTDMDREYLEGLSVELAPTVRSRNYTEQFYLYRNLCKASERLYVSWSRMGMDGKSLRPSYLIGKLRQLFPNVPVQEPESEDRFSLMAQLRRDGGMNYLLAGLEREWMRKEACCKEVCPEEISHKKISHEEISHEEAWKVLVDYYLGIEQKDASFEFYCLLSGYGSIAVQNRLQKSVARALYGEITGSVTRLEQFASCAFGHFLDYGLRLLERQEYTIRIPDIGSIFHDAIRRFSEKMKASGIRWGEVEPERRQKLVRESVEEATLEYGNRILHSTKRMEALIDRVERITDRTVWAICEQVKLGEFEPKEFEIQFSLEALKGRIDRIDTAENKQITQEGRQQEVEYLRIIDYKSGGTDFDLNRFYYGLGMQLVIYLSCAMEKEKQENPNKLVVPAGIFYYHIQDPLVEKGSGEENLLKELAMKGLASRDVVVEGMMDRTLVDEMGMPVPSAKSWVIPVAFTKEGVHTATSHVASQQQMELLMEYAHKQVEILKEQILSGEIGAMPYQLEGQTGCDYCKYRSICGFDRRIPGYQNRQMESLAESEIWEKLSTTLTENKTEKSATEPTGENSKETGKQEE